MGSIWLSKKSFLYFGGALIILLGGFIVVLAPYHYVNFSVIQNDQRTFEIYDAANYYPQLEISVSLRPINLTIVYIDLTITNNATLEMIGVNITLTAENEVTGPQGAIFYEDRVLVDIAPGNYTIRLDRVLGVSILNLGFNQVSDSRLFIIIGGSLNIIGIIMVIGGYCLPGTLLPSDSDTIISWGYDEEESEDTQL